jgi:N-acetylmuramoyl-L-alanine amidase
MFPAARWSRSLLVALALPAGCARLLGPGAPAPVPPLPKDARAPGGLPPVPERHGPLRIAVVYPEAGSRVDAPDSSFVFGSVGDGGATLSINGEPVPVAPNGAWLAWLPFRGDSVVVLHLEARTATDSASLDYLIRRTPRFAPLPEQRLWVDTTTMMPAGRIWWPREEYLSLSVRASEGASLALLLPDGTRVPFAPDRAADPVPEGLRAFDRDTLQLRRVARADRYRSVLRGLALGDPGPLLDPGGGAAGGEATLVAVQGGDTVRARWPLRLALMDTLPSIAELDDDRAGRGGTDSITVGRATPGGTYTWFFPAGTRARVTGRVNGELRLALSERSTAWVAAAEAYPVPGARPGPHVVGSVTLYPHHDRVTARIPVGARIPFQVVETERELALVLYGAVSDVNWLRYGAEDRLVSLVTVRQTAADELELRFALGAPVWGYRTRWDGNDLLLEIRRPPDLDPAAPLRGRTIVVDPGHPPAGATGPTGLAESEANLGIGLELRRLLLAEGAQVLMTRSDARAVDLWPRVRFADSSDAELMVSIHNNALPDGVNPFTNNGASTFYNHPRALPLARLILRRLVARFGVRDLGVGRGDLALVRPTWMPAVLTEGLFLMLPEQEAALRDPEGRRQYALAVMEGIRRFLYERAREQTDGKEAPPRSGAPLSPPRRLPPGIPDHPLHMRSTPSGIGLADHRSDGAGAGGDPRGRGAPRGGFPRAARRAVGGPAPGDRRLPRHAGDGHRLAGPSR